MALYMNTLDDGWSDKWDDVPEEMINAFMDAGLDRLYPFNRGCPDSYVEECNQNTTHLNCARIDWVRKQIKRRAV
jgi:hypothetical protein